MPIPSSDGLFRSLSPPATGLCSLKIPALLFVGKFFFQFDMRLYEGLTEVMSHYLSLIITSDVLVFIFGLLYRIFAEQELGDQFYASYPAGIELLTDTTKQFMSHLLSHGQLDGSG